MRINYENNDLSLSLGCHSELADHIKQAFQSSLRELEEFGPQKTIQIINGEARLNRLILFRKFAMLHGIAQLF